LLLLGHVWHAAEPAALYCPAVHAWHAALVAEPGLLTYLPASQGWRGWYRQQHSIGVTDSSRIRQPAAVHTDSERAATQDTARGVTHHRATDRGGRPRGGGAPVASNASACADRVFVASGSGEFPARRASSRCSSTRQPDVLPGRAGGAGGAARQGVLPGIAGHAARGIRRAALLASRTGLQGLPYKLAAEGSEHSSRFQSNRHR
jgi:hypothetical protein